MDIDNWLYVIIAFIFGNISATLLNWIKLIQEVKRIFKKKSLESYEIKSEYWGHNSNPRFGFSFSEPLSWDRIDPHNNDGYKYMNPEDSNVHFSLSGQYDALELSTIEAIVEWHLSIYKKKKGFKLVSSNESGRILYDYPDEKTVVRQNVSGWKMIYDSLHEGKRIRSMDFISKFDDTIFHIHCQAPKNQFKKYENFFMKIITSFSILGTNSAPFARENVIESE